MTQLTSHLFPQPNLARSNFKDLIIFNGQFVSLETLRGFWPNEDDDEDDDKRERESGHQTR